MYINSSRFMKYAALVLLQLGCITAFSQLAVNEPVVDKFKAYSTNAIQEKLFLHTDKEFYLAGEIIWFKIYYVDGTSHLPMDMSKLAYTEILNSNNEPVLQTKIPLQPGAGEGSFYLPASLTTGNYTIKAYTNWMKNFDAAWFFEKKITIVNTLKAPEVAGAADSVTTNLNFFPEGGNLVSNIRSRVGFMVTGNTGGVNDCTGYIVGNNNDTITSFRPLKFGIGNFEFTPVAGNTYKAIVSLPDGKVVTKNLPEIYENGYAMSLRENGQQIAITIKIKRKAGEQNAVPVLLAGHTKQLLRVAEKTFITANDSAVFFIDKSRIGQGITYFTLFDGANNPVCERLFYTKPASAISLQVKADQATYGNRQKINLSVSTGGSGATGSPLHLSASVFYADTLQKDDPSTIVDYMWLTSELTGNVETPGWYFSNDADVNAATDNLMMTHGWRRFKWNDILAGGTGFIKYMPEINGHVVTGRLKDSRNDKPVGNENAYLSVQTYPFGFYTAQSDKNGLLFFEVKDFYGNSQVIAGPGIGVDSFYRVEIFKPYADAVAGKRYPAYRVSAELKDKLLQRSVGMQVQNIYTGDSLRHFVAQQLADTLPFYGLPEAMYQLDEYKRFTTMEEVLREYVREVGVGLRNTKLIFRIFDPIAHDFYTDNSLVLLDGVPLADPNKIFFYDPLKIRRLDVIRDRYVMGQSSFNGIASFTTYNAAFDAFDFDPRLLAIDYGGLQLQREFYSPSYASSEQLQKRIPDFRNTLLWAPTVITGKDGTAALQFYSSDLKGRYLVRVQGMNEKGDFVSSTTTIDVK